MGIGLSIVFSGLCALVTDGGGGAGQVILVDAKSLGEVGGVPLPAHAPTLVMDLRSLVNPETSLPDRVVAGWPGAGSVGQVGFWDLTGSEVRIRVQGSDRPGLRVFQPEDGASSWPAPPRDGDNPAAWRDIRFVPDMTSLVGDGRIDPSLLANVDGTLPRGVAARVHLEAGLVEAGLPSREEYRDDVFEFATTGHRGTLRQALTDTLRWGIDTRSDAVVIEIAPASGGPARRLVLKAASARHEMFVGNLPVHDALAHESHALADESLAALHFAAYYELLRRSPESRPLPRLIHSTQRPSTGLWAGPVCPTARFRSN